MARFYKFVRLKKGLRRAELKLLTPYIRFWSDNAECSVHCGRTGNPEDRLTVCRIIEVLLYMHFFTSFYVVDVQNFFIRAIDFEC